MARQFDPLLVNSVVGFIGPEYLLDGKQVIRAGLEDHFCGKLLGLPMGCDVCYTNHMDVDQDDMDVLLTALGAAGCSYIMGVPGGDDVMLGYQSTSFHDAQYVRQVLGLRPAPEFEAWLQRMDLVDDRGRVSTPSGTPALMAALDLAPMTDGLARSTTQEHEVGELTPARSGSGGRVAACRPRPGCSCASTMPGRATPCAIPSTPTAVVAALAGDRSRERSPSPQRPARVTSTSVGRISAARSRSTPPPRCSGRMPTGATWRSCSATDCHHGRSNGTGRAWSSGSRRTNV